MREPKILSNSPEINSLNRYDKLFSNHLRKKVQYCGRGVSPETFPISFPVLLVCLLNVRQETQATDQQEISPTSCGRGLC